MKEGNYILIGCIVLFILKGADIIRQLTSVSKVSVDG